MSSVSLPIGRLAASTGCKIQTIRYYEDIGLLPAPERSRGNQRRYTANHTARLAFIRHARELGFSLDDIRQLLDLADDPNRSCEDADALARHHLAEVRSRIRRLQSLEAELARMARFNCRGRVAKCRVIEVLADHSHRHCLAKHHAG